MLKEKKCWVQLERVEVAMKNTEQVQTRPAHMEETRLKKVGPPGELELQKAKKHPNDALGRGKVKCDECGQSLSKNNLQRHRVVVHRGVAPYKCWVGDCGMRFASTSRLANHRRVNHGYPKLMCEVEGCGSEFLLRSQLHSHRKTHQGKTDCDECGKSIASSYLSTHMQLVHRGEKPYACKVMDCTESFSRNQGLGDHERKVHGY